MGAVKKASGASGAKKDAQRANDEQKRKYEEQLKREREEAAVREAALNEQKAAEAAAKTAARLKGNEKGGVGSGEGVVQTDLIQRENVGTKKYRKRTGKATATAGQGLNVGGSGGTKGAGSGLNIGGR